MKRSTFLTSIFLVALLTGLGLSLAIAQNSHAGPICYDVDPYVVGTAGCCTTWDGKAGINKIYYTGITDDGVPCGGTYVVCEKSRLCAGKTPVIQ